MQGGSQNLTAFRRVIEEGFSGGNEAVIDEFAADDFVEHQYGMEPANAEGTKGAIRFLHRLAPDFQLVIEDLVEAGDCVWGRMTGTGTHTGPGLGEPTHRRWKITVMDVCRFRDGRMVEHWGVPDRLAQMEQLGLLPGRGRPGLG